MIGRLADVIRPWCSGFVDLFFPRTCSVCGRMLVRGEDVICLHCLSTMPRTGLHISQPNEIHERLISLRVRVERGASLFYYKRNNPYAHIIHNSKYRGCPSIGRKLAQMYAIELSAVDFFNGMDIILPIPLHYTRLWSRGYNQSYHIAKGISDISHIPIGDNLVAAHRHSSQTRRGRESRRDNIHGVFSINNADDLAGHHILLVDDVITTGATMIEAAETLESAIPDIRISVLSLALTHNL